jgi:dTDP-4-dehydrorhamnose 3,5-epimerase
VIEVLETRLPGCLELQPAVYRDIRGSFVKPFALSEFESLGLSTTWRELFYSQSTSGVVRGLHFQEPPAAQDKLVQCIVGSVFDVVVDLRAGSPTFGEFEVFALDDEKCSAVYMPVGFAHGFATISTDATLAYLVSNEHDPTRDAGLRWDSLSIPWPVDRPVVSERDRGLPRFADYDTPFVFESSLSG